MNSDNMSDSIVGSLGFDDDTTLTIGDFDDYCIDATQFGTIDSIDLTTTTITGSTGFYPTVKIDNHGIDVQPEADIKIGDRSLKDFMDKVEERLNILQPNPALEQEWDQLKQLGEQYRKLEAEILEKQKIWKSLKQ